MTPASAHPLYDHARPRRRPAPDWGGDDLFDAVPRRRFAREQEEAESRPELRLVPAETPVEVEVLAPVRPRSRPVEQRIHARPDRLAAWAFALGLLLIVIAVATSA